MGCMSEPGPFYTWAQYTEAVEFEKQKAATEIAALNYTVETIADSCREQAELLCSLCAATGTQFAMCQSSRYYIYIYVNMYA